MLQVEVTERFAIFKMNTSTKDREQNSLKDIRTISPNLAEKSVPTREQTKKIDFQGQTVAKTRIRRNHNASRIHGAAFPVSACLESLSPDVPV